jgi:transposase InsO family protein
MAEAIQAARAPAHPHPARPRAGRPERFNRTLLEEWAYARPYRSEAERRRALPHRLHLYNHHRGHTALGASHPPAASPTCRDTTPRSCFPDGVLV